MLKIMTLLIGLLCCAATELCAASSLEEAYKDYSTGEAAATYSERQADFNKALGLYIQNAGADASGSLDYDIANTLFQLEEYPLAIFYYYRALRQAPFNDNIKTNLALAQKKLGIPEQNGKFRFPRPYLWTLFFILACFAFIAWSLSLWFNPIWKKIWPQLAIASIFVLGALTYLYYFEPVEGVILKDTLLYTGAGNGYPPVKTVPLLSGFKVEILEATSDGQWLKISAPDGTVGFVPYTTLKII